jgi:hypothetical protein
MDDCTQRLPLNSAEKVRFEYFQACLRRSSRRLGEKGAEIIHRTGQFSQIELKVPAPSDVSFVRVRSHQHLIQACSISQHPAAMMKPRGRQ